MIHKHFLPLASILLVAGSAPSAAAGKVKLLTPDSDGPSYVASVSGSGRHVAYLTHATNHTNPPGNGLSQVVLLDRKKNKRRLVSQNSFGNASNGSAVRVAISASGRFVAFTSHATDLVPGDTNGVRDAFLYDAKTKTISRVSVGDSGQQGLNGETFDFAISYNGRWIGFLSAATNLGGAATTGIHGYRFDRKAGTGERVALGPTGQKPDQYVFGIAVSGNGRLVAFSTAATNFGSHTGFPSGNNIWLRDVKHGSTELISGGYGGQNSDASSYNPALDKKGRRVAFSSSASNLAKQPAATYQSRLHVFDRKTGKVRRFTLPNVQGKKTMAIQCALSRDGKIAAVYGSTEISMFPFPETFYTAFRVAVTGGSIKNVAVDKNGVAANASTSRIEISADGRSFVFGTGATNLPGGEDQHYDVYMRKM